MNDRCFFCTVNRDKCCHGNDDFYMERLAWFADHGAEFNEPEEAERRRDGAKVELARMHNLRDAFTIGESRITEPHGTPEFWAQREQAIQDDLKRIKENEAGGRKADSGKPRYELVPQAALAEVVKVLTHGASKYGDFNYMLVEDERYIGAIGRHLAQHLGVSLEGEEVSEYDQHTGLLHLAHIACNALILLQKRLSK